MDYAEAGIGKSAFARLSENEDLLETVTQVAMKTRIHAGFFILIGTLKSAKLGFFRHDKYETIEMQQPLEIVSCLGNISMKEGKVFAHAHVAVSDEKGRAFGGHVMPGCIIGATGELVLIETSGIQLFRKLEERTRLSLLSFKSSAGAEKKKSTRRAV
jgi:predicted DNA-binding protein with PD1-like motif